MKILSPLDRLLWLADVAADHGISSVGLRVAMVLPVWIGKDGSCFPAVGSVGAAIKMVERSARRGLRELEDRGWLTTNRSTGRTSNVYRLTRTTIDRVEPGQLLSGLDGLNPDKNDAQPGQIRTSTRTRMRSNPDKNAFQPGQQLSA